MAKYKFYTSSLWDRHFLFLVVIDGQCYKQMLQGGANLFITWNGKWETDGYIKGKGLKARWVGTNHQYFVDNGDWKEITAEEAKNKLPEGYRDNFAFPQCLRK